MTVDGRTRSLKTSARLVLVSMLFSQVKKEVRTRKVISVVALHCSYCNRKPKADFHEPYA